jgi:hypothetical protein
VLQVLSVAVQLPFFFSRSENPATTEPNSLFRQTARKAIYHLRGSLSCRMWISDARGDMTTRYHGSDASTSSWPSTKRRIRADDEFRRVRKRGSSSRSISGMQKPMDSAEGRRSRTSITPRLLGIALLLLGTPAHLFLPAHAFYFQWSSTSYQCYTQTLSWVGGVPPFKAIIA